LVCQGTGDERPEPEKVIIGVIVQKVVLKKQCEGARADQREKKVERTGFIWVTDAGIHPRPRLLKRSNLDALLPSK